MDYLLLILALLLLGTCIVLFLQIRKQQDIIDELLQDNPDPDPDADPQMILTMTVLDPLELAKRESRSARMLADRLPVMVTRMVYQEVREEVEEELRRRGIEAETKIEYR